MSAPLKERGRLRSIVPYFATTERGREVWFDDGVRAIAVAATDVPDLLGVVVCRPGSRVAAQAGVEEILREPWRNRWCWTPQRQAWQAANGARLMLVGSDRIERLRGCEVDVALEYDDPHLCQIDDEVLRMRLLRARITYP